MSDCQFCGGDGRIAAIHVNEGYDETTGRCKGHWRFGVPCDDCGGTGQWSDERMAWWRRGQAMRDARMARGESAAAKRMGVRPSQVSAWELGREEPPA